MPPTSVDQGTTNTQYIKRMPTKHIPFYVPNSEQTISNKKDRLYF